MSTPLPPEHSEQGRTAAEPPSALAVPRAGNSRRTKASAGSGVDTGPTTWDPGACACAGARACAPPGPTAAELVAPVTEGCVCRDLTATAPSAVTAARSATMTSAVVAAPNHPRGAGR